MKDIGIGQMSHDYWTVRLLVLDVYMVCFHGSGEAKQNNIHRCEALISGVTGRNPRDVRGCEGTLSRGGFTFDMQKIARLDVAACGPCVFNFGERPTGATASTVTPCSLARRSGSSRHFWASLMLSRERLTRKRYCVRMTT